jgi:hypothetical protein
MARSFLILLVLAVLGAGLFGALHNQLSYSVGASYFHDLKFGQFGISEDWQNRAGAALVGWRASWWMGLALGLPVFGLGLVLVDRPNRFRALGLAVLVLALILALAGAMGGLALGMIAPGYATSLPLPEGIGNPAGYLRAALMHEGAYMGAALALPIGLWIMWRARRSVGPKERKKA